MGRKSDKTSEHKEHYPWTCPNCGGTLVQQGEARYCLSCSFKLRREAWQKFNRLVSIGLQRNPAERAFASQAALTGWQVSKSGWPDFACFRNGKLVVVEVKPHSNQPLEESQERLISALAAFGVPCYVWSPDGGLQRVRPKGRRQVVGATTDPPSGMQH